MANEFYQKLIAVDVGMCCIVLIFNGLIGGRPAVAPLAFITCLIVMLVIYLAAMFSGKPPKKKEVRKQ